MSTIGFLLLLIVVVAVILVYSIRLQRKAVATQDIFANDHLLEKERRERQYRLAEESAEIQKQAIAREEEALQLLKRSVELQENILKALREPRN